MWEDAKRLCGRAGRVVDRSHRVDADVFVTAGDREQCRSVYPRREVDRTQVQPGNDVRRVTLAGQVDEGGGVLRDSGGEGDRTTERCTD